MAALLQVVLNGLAGVDYLIAGAIALAVAVVGVSLSGSGSSVQRHMIAFALLLAVVSAAEPEHATAAEVEAPPGRRPPRHRRRMTAPCPRRPTRSSRRGARTASRC